MTDDMAESITTTTTTHLFFLSVSYLASSVSNSKRQTGQVQCLSNQSMTQALQEEEGGGEGK